MSDLDEVVRQAVLAQKDCGTSDSVLEEFCKLLKLDLSTAKVVTYGCSRYCGHDHDEDDSPSFTEGVYEEFDEHTRELINKAYDIAFARVRCRRAIMANGTVGIPLHLMLDDKDADQLCVQCPRALACLALQETTPTRCYNYRVRVLACTPIRLHEMHVEVKNPFDEQILRVRLADVSGPGTAL